MKITKEKALLAYGKQYKDWCNKHGKFGHKSTDQKCLENKGKCKDEKRIQKDQSINKKEEDISTALLTVKSMVRKHPIGTFWVLNPKQRSNLTHDVTFLDKLYD